MTPAVEILHAKTHTSASKRSEDSETTRQYKLLANCLYFLNFLANDLILLANSLTLLANNLNLLANISRCSQLESQVTRRWIAEKPVPANNLPVAYDE